MATLKYCKVRDVKSPTRAHLGDAGIDFFVPNDVKISELAEKMSITNCHISYQPDLFGNVATYYLKPNESVLIPSGIKVKVPDGYMLKFTNKSGIAAKKHLLVGSSVVDFGYQGECNINLHNVGQETIAINAGDKIVQGILIPIGLHQPEEVKDETELYNNEVSERSTGGFGSSGN